MSTILLVEDNPHIMKINSEMLTMRGYEILKAVNAAQCMDILKWNPVDLVILDIMLPDRNGLELCRDIKEMYHVPILFLSAMGDNCDIIEGLRAGGDDYLTKPYDLDVLAAKIKARLRSVSDIRRYVCYGCLKLDTLSMCGYIYGKDMFLTQKEFSLLLLLVQNKGKAVTTSEIIREIWGVGEQANSRALWTLISRLRKKLKNENARLEISSQRGDGYFLERI